VVVRLGKTGDEGDEQLRAWRGAMIDAFRH
jgi:hypothetical protein